jgi:hypothetical protein
MPSALCRNGRDQSDDRSNETGLPLALVYVAKLTGSSMLSPAKIGPPMSSLPPLTGCGCGRHIRLHLAVDLERNAFGGLGRVLKAASIANKAILTVPVHE